MVTIYNERFGPRCDSGRKCGLWEVGTSERTGVP